VPAWLGRFPRIRNSVLSHPHLGLLQQLRASAIASEGQTVKIQTPYPPVAVSRPSVMSAHRPCPCNTDFGTASGRPSPVPRVAHATINAFSGFDRQHRTLTIPAIRLHARPTGSASRSAATKSCHGAVPPNPSLQRTPPGRLHRLWPPMTSALLSRLHCNRRRR
jgi:hypothetical protein